MKIIDKLASVFKKKTGEIAGVEYGGLELLNRLTTGTWSKEKMLEQYSKSLYVFACVSKIAEKVGSTDIDLFTIKNTRGDVKEIQNSPVLDLLYKPNPFQTKSDFLKITIINKKLCGDAFWFKVRNGSGQVIELWNLRPDYMEIIKDPELFIKAYKFNKGDGTSEIFDPNDIVHFKYVSPTDAHYGMGPVKPAATRIETEGYASDYQKDFFLNNGRPDAILKSVGAVALSEEQKNDMRTEFEKRHKGVGKNSKMAIIEGELDYQQVSISQREMDYIESVKFTRDDILTAFGVPKPIVSITDDVNRANAETAMYIFLSETIKPELDMLDDTINEMLVYPEFSDRIFIQFPDPTPENREMITTEYKTGLEAGYLLINEVRAKENLEPIDGGWGLYKPMNMVVVGGLGKQEKAKYINDWKEKKAQELESKKLKVFRGKDILYKKLELQEEILKAVKKELNVIEIEKQKEKIAKKKKRKKELVPLIKSDIRDKYAELVIKTIDKKAKKMEEEMNKLAKKQLNSLLKLVKKRDLKKEIGKKTKTAINDFYVEQEKVFAEFSLPFIEEFLKTAGQEAMDFVDPNKEFEMTEAIHKATQERADEFGLGVNNTTKEKVYRDIEKGLKEGEGNIAISDRIKETYKEYPTWRSDMIARTESTAANNDGFIEAYKQSGVVTHKEWIATKDDRTRPEHMEMDGQIVKVGKNFSNGLPYPQEPNCRCVIGPAFES